MASLVLGVAGAVVGSALGPGGAQIGYMIGSALGAALFPPAGQDGPRLNDLKAQSSTYGSNIPIVYGTFRVAGNVIWSTQLVEHAHDQGGGSGGGGFTTYTYTCSFAVMLCEGEKGVRKIWADGKLIYDLTNTANPVQFKASSYKLYTGTETQLPDPIIEADKGVGNVPAYRGLAYWVFADLELAKFGNRIPNLTFEMFGDGSGSESTLLFHPIQDYYGTQANAAQNFSLAYNPATNKLWQLALYLTLDDSTLTGSYAIIDADTMQVVGSTSLEPGWPGGPAGVVVGDPYDKYEMATPWLIFNPVDNSMWSWENGDDIIRVFDATTGAMKWEQQYTPGGSNGLENLWVNPFNGQVWMAYTLVSGVGSPATYLKQVSTVDGSILHSFLVTPTSYDIFDLSFDSAGNAYGSVSGVSSPIAYMTKFSLPSSTQTAIITLPAGDYFWYQTYDTVRDHIIVIVVHPYPTKPSLRVYSNTGTLITDWTIPDTIDWYLYPDPWYDPVRDVVWISKYDNPNYTILALDPMTLLPVRESAPVLGGDFLQIVQNSPVSAVYAVSHNYNGIVRYSFGTADVPITLAEVVADISSRTPLTTDQYDVEQLTDIVEGFCIATGMAARAAVEPLAQAYFFETVESDGKIKFIKRGSSPVTSITATTTLLEGTQ